MARQRIILIADPDVRTVRALKSALRDEYEILVAKDGSKALELSVLKYPNLILFHRRCPLIGAAQFLKILRTNPRTEEIPLIVLADEPMAAGAPGYLEGVLVKPLNLDEVRTRIAEVFRKVDTAKEMSDEAGSVAGSLDQISMADLLQIFSVNRRSGALQVTVNEQDAEVFLHDGRIEDARVGEVRGEKALYRLLTWSGGRFVFAPGRRATQTSLDASTDSLLMEGMRQSDELARMREELPALTARVERMVPNEGLPEGLHPITAEIFHLAEHYQRVSDLLDRAQAADLQVYDALRSLLQAKLLRVVADAAPGVRPLLSQDQILDLRSRLRRAGLPPTYLNNPKVLVVSADAKAVWRLGVALSHLTEFVAGDLEVMATLAVGTVGSLKLDPALSVDFFAVTAEDRLLPMVLALTAGAVAGVVVGGVQAAPLARLLALLESERRVALLFVRGVGEPEPPGEPRFVVEAGEDFAPEWTRDLLTMLLTQVAGADLRGTSL